MSKPRSKVRRILVPVIVIAAVVVLAAVWLVRGPSPTAFAGGKTVALVDYHGANPTGVPASLSQADPIARGEYLARAADCTACHTAPTGKELAGGLGFKLPFGTLYSTNITPDKDTGIGNYTDAEFIAAVRQGVRRDGARLYPAMPYASYSYLTDADVLAIKAYLFSVPAVRVAAPTNTLAFPFDQRWAMLGWSVVFNRDTRYAPNTSQSAEWNRGAYLAEALAHCGECHTPRNIGFALDNRNKFAGAVAAGWRAFDITSHKVTGVGNWSDADLGAYLSTGHATGHGTASGPMGEAVDHSFRYLTSGDIGAIVTYLRSVPPIASPDLLATPAPAAPPSHRDGVMADARGKMVFEGACVSCHGWSGESAVSPLATLTGAAALNDPSAINVAQIVISGTRRLTPDGALSMPGFGNAYSDTEIAALANYVTGRFGRSASRITPHEVAELRKQASN
jgi:mono/diheme cytochrome c family protein